MIIVSTAVQEVMMPGRNKTILICSCEDTMALDSASIAKGCPGAKIEAGHNLCRSQIDLFAKVAGKAPSIIVACTQEESRFQDVLEEMQSPASVTFTNIREKAGWSTEGSKAAPKMAALLAGAMEPAISVPVLTLESQGIAAIYGRDATAIAVAEHLENDLNVTVILTRPGDISPPRHAAFPVLKGTVRQAKGHLGAFELIVDDVATPAPSSRGSLSFGPSRNEARSQCDLVIDVSGLPPMFSAHDLRDGYLRADPADPVAIEKLISKARTLVGTFDKPRYVHFTPDICAHSRSKITGCIRCLDVCPTGAIVPTGDSMAIDPAICGGCGGCAAVCPTGAAAYALPPSDAMLRKLRGMLNAYHAAGGSKPMLLLHDNDHGEALIHALSHHGMGLPAHVIPVAINEVTQLGLESIAAAYAYGAAGFGILAASRPKHDPIALNRTIALARDILAGLGYDPASLFVLNTDDPDVLSDRLASLLPGPVARKRASFQPQGKKRPLLHLALKELKSGAPAPAETIALGSGAPFGKIIVNAEGCTLCHACVSACPADALSANPEKPELRFIESLCVQCGLCARTCPEKVITLEPVLDFAALEAGPVVLKQEDPYACDNCGKPFGTKSTIAKIRSKLAGSHWMYSGTNADRASLIGLCEECRVTSVVNNALDPYAAPRPVVRTSEDYLREREMELNRAELEQAASEQEKLKPDGIH